MKTRFNSRSIMMITLISFLTGMTMTMGLNCSRPKLLSSPSSGEQPDGMGSPSDQQSLGIAFMTAEQLLNAMISSTGVGSIGDLSDPANDLINQTFIARSGSLPSTKSLDQATAPTMIAITNLASTVCAKAVDIDRAISPANADQRLFFKEMDFNAGLSSQSASSISLGFERIARNAWRRPAQSDEVSMILDFSQEFSVGVSGTDSAQTRMLAISICTAALSSIDALTY